MKKSVKKRITVTGAGKVLRKPMATSHGKTRKSKKNLMRKRGRKGLNYPERKILDY